MAESERGDYINNDFSKQFQSSQAKVQETIDEVHKIQQDLKDKEHEAVQDVILHRNLANREWQEITTSSQKRREETILETNKELDKQSKWATDKIQDSISEVTKIQQEFLNTQSKVVTEDVAFSSKIKLEHSKLADENEARRETLKWDTEQQILSERDKSEKVMGLISPEELAKRLQQEEDMKSEDLDTERKYNDRLAEINSQKAKLKTDRAKLKEAKSFNCRQT